MCMQIYTYVQKHSIECDMMHGSLGLDPGSLGHQPCLAVWVLV